MSSPLDNLREHLETVLYEHRERALTCCDHAPTPDHPVWCCVCGAHELLVSHRSHVAAALVRVAADVWDEACEHDIAVCRDGCAHNPYREAGA